jgi:CHAT domain-containing protein
VTAALLLAMLAAQTPGADSLRVLAVRLPESALAAEARARPLAAREAVAGALAAGDLVAARRLAAAHAEAWSDSFLIRDVQRFAAWPPSRRAARVWVDSVRRVGVAAFGRDGPMAAIAVWRRAYRRASANSDSAAMAGLFANIGAGFLEESRLDSAEPYLERAHTLSVTVGDRRVEGNAVQLLADIQAERGELERARQGYARAVTLREQIGDSRGLASARTSMGLLAQAVGDLADARRQFEAALAINRRDGRDESAAVNLVNLAGLASLEGDFARAEQWYRDALATWRTREQWADAAVALHGLGQLELRRGDYPAAVAVLREALVILDRTGPVGDAVEVRRFLASALAARGDLQGAIDHLRIAQTQADSGAAPDVRAGLALARGDLAFQLNQLAEAGRWYALAEVRFRQAEDWAGVAEAQQGQGLILIERDDFARAQPLLEAALRSQREAGNRRGAELTRLLLGRLAALRGDTATARRQLDGAIAELDRLADPVATAAALAERGSLEVGAVAESLYRAGLARLDGRVAPEVAWGLHLGLAQAFRARGAMDAAARELRTAAADLQRAGRSLVLPERRAAFLADKWDVYAELALVERARGRPGAAFEASERLRARDMVELLGRGRVSAPSDTAAELVAREQDLRRRIAELMQEAEGAGSGELRGPDLTLPAGATRAALLRAQEFYAELLLELRERAPRHAALLSRDVAEWRDVAQRLAPDEAFVEYLLTDSASLAFVVVRDSLSVVDLGVGRREVARQVEFARGTLERRAVQQADSMWRAPLRRLHGELIAPIEDAGLLAGKTRLVLVPHAELHYLPFAALTDAAGEGQARFLVERYELALTPSASVWLALARRRSPGGSAGALALAPKPDVLPASRREVEAIGRRLGTDALVVAGGDATEAAFRREAPRRRVLHLATYGLLNKQNPLFSFVELGAGEGHDGRLEVHEVFGLDLAADLVVLSACQTGLGSGAVADVPAGDDWVSLTRAFLHAGAASVVATLWPVEDLATASLMEQFYGNTPERDPARALARAQRALLTRTATSHPFYWAGFVTVDGAGRGAGDR